MTEEGGALALGWAELPAETRAQLAGRLAGLYGHGTDESAFDSLAEDKRQALQIFVRRFAIYFSSAKSGSEGGGSAAGAIASGQNFASNVGSFTHW